MNETTYVYIVHSDINENNIYAEFEKEEEAIDYARRNKDELTYVDKVEVALDEDGDIIEMFDSETIWVYDYENDSLLTENKPLKLNQEEEAEFYKLCREIGIIDWKDVNAFKQEVGCDNSNLLQALRDYRNELGLDFDITKADNRPLNFNIDDLVEELEENEDIVECKECFELFPKQDGFKIDLGYICPHCHQAKGSSEVHFEPDFEISDEDIFKVDFPEYEKFRDTDDLFADDEEVPGLEGKSIEDVLAMLVKDEEEAIDGYEKAAEVIEHSNVESKEEILDVLDHIKDEEKEHIEELVAVASESDLDDVEEVENPEIEEKETTPLVEDSTVQVWDCFFDGDFIGTVEATDEHDAYSKMEETWPELPYGLYDGVAYVVNHEEEGLTEAKCQDCGGELKDNKCTSCNRDFNLAKCKHCGGEVKDGKCMYCDTKVDIVKCQYCGGEVIDNKCTSCNESVESTSEVLVEAAGSKDKIKSEFDEAGYVTEGTYTFDKIYDAYVKAKKSEPASLKDFIEYIRETVISVNELYGTLGLPAPETYKVKRKAVAKMRADGSTFTEAIPMTRDELMDKEGTDDVELINAGRPEEERVELVEEETAFEPKPED